MKDPRGVERGKCLSPGCTCTMYELEPMATRAACTYCECPCTKHEEIKVGSPTVVSPNSSFISNTSASPFSITPSKSNTSTSFLSNTPSKSNTSTSFLSNTTSSSNTSSSFLSFTPSSSNTSKSSFSITPQSEPMICVVPNAQDANDILQDLIGNQQAVAPVSLSPEIQKLIPKRFPPRVMANLQSRTLTAADKDKIVQDTVQSLYQNDLISNAALEKGASKLVQKYSPMKDPLDPDLKNLRNKMKRRLSRVMSQGGKKSKDDESSNPCLEISPKDAKEQMLLDWNAGIRSKAAHEKHMQVTRQMRKEDAQKYPGFLLFRQYPALAIPELVLEDFVAIYTVDKEVMFANWYRALPYLVDYLSKWWKCDPLASLEEKTIFVLQHLHKVPLWYKKSNDKQRSSKVLEVFPPGTSDDDMRPHPKDPPRLILCGDGNEPYDIHCYLDSVPFFSSQQPTEAMLLMLAGYFIMNIKWPACARLPMVVLCCATIGATHVGSDIARNGKFQDFLKEINLLD